MNKITVQRWKMVAYRGLPYFLLAAGILVLTLLTHDEITRSGNETSRMALVESLGDRGVFHIDGSRFKTVDMGRIGSHFYSDKPLLYSLYLSTVYGVGKAVGLSFDADYYLTIFVLNWFGSTLFAILIMITLFLSLRRKEGTSESVAALLALTGVFGTWLVSYGGIINNHVPAAWFLLLFALLLERWSSTGRSRHLALAGFCVGILINLDIPTGFFFALAGGAFLLFRAPGRRDNVFRYGVFLSLPILFTTGCNLIAYGNPLPVYMVHGAYDFAGNIHSSGLAGLQQPVSRTWYVLDLLVWQRGLFSYMPALLLLAAAGPFLYRRFRDRHAEGFFLAGAVLLCLIFYSFATGDYGGWAYGFRFFIPLLPLLWLWLSAWLIAAAGRTWRVLFGLLAVVGIFTSLVGSYNPWPVCRNDNRLLINTLKFNLYCAAYEYGNGTAVEVFSRPLLQGINRNEYLPRAFANMRKLENTRPQDWPAALSHRRTIAMKMLGIFPDGAIPEP